MRAKKKLYQSLSIASQLGFSIAIPLVGGALLGSFLDSKFDTAPKLTLSLIFFGLFISGYNMYKIMKEVK
ncbi:AtpZ/AtpI family protein [Candidatus Gottesmanbacteria bacterium]|nr:AtpZ/AtpI family protein [Candidatus Gottesmanbacteria bacterium]